MIVIVDYGMGNLRSIQNMLKHIGSRSDISSNPNEIKKADKLILPGVGAFDSAVENIDRLGLRKLICQKAIEEKTPLLGICLGMQLLGEKSEEGRLSGLGLIQGDSVKFRNDDESRKLTIPHMGWNTAKIEKEDPLLRNMYETPRYYFVHSYHFCCRNPKDVLCTTQYGDKFTSAIALNNIWGVQFHPEKSHKFGMKLLSNFAELKQDVSKACHAMPVA